MMERDTKERLIALGKALLHSIIPIIVVFIILDIWAKNISSEVEMSKNIFITISCFGSAILVLLASFYVHWIMDKYCWSKFREIEQRHR